MVDYLYKYSVLTKNIEKLIKAAEYEKAWKLTFEVDTVCVKHTANYGKDAPSDWVLCFSNSASEYRAHILSKEGKHVDALFNGAFRAIVEHRPIAKYEKKMMVYFRKANLNCTESEFLTLFNSAKKSKDLALFEKKFRLLTKK
jgi:hypothetical protein